MIVVDASVALQWIVPERDGQADAESVLTADTLFAPDLLLVEVANALRRKIASGEARLEQALRGMRTLSSTVQLVPIGADLAISALEMAVEMDHPAYDCIYLALARANGAQVATRDSELTRRAAKAGLGYLVATLPMPDVKQ